MGRPARSVHLDLSRGADVWFGLVLGKDAQALAKCVSAAVLYALYPGQGWFEESRRPPVRGSSARRSTGLQWRNLPLSAIIFCLTALVFLVPLVCYLLVVVVLSPDALSSPSKSFQGLPFGLSSSINKVREEPRPPIRPQLIPRLIHQTFKSAGSLPERAEQLRKSWRDKNPGWTLRLWDDEDCDAFVRDEFPNYYQAYKGLPKDVERADFFRYLVVYRLGGVYADIDTECKVSLDTVIRQSDTLVVGWEAEVPDADAALRRHFSRVRQIQQWMFAGVPDHPALRTVCDHINANYKKEYSKFTNMDTLERTGPGAWTDAVLKCAVEHSHSQVDDLGRVRILPQVATGVHPKGTSGIDPLTKGVVVQHHFLGSWKKKGGWRRTGIVESAKKLLGLVPPQPSKPMTVKGNNVRHFPVSISHSMSFPSFTVLVDLVGQGDFQSREEVGAILTKYGNWQAGSDPTMGPFAVAAVTGALGEAALRPVFVDIGAGIGFYSLYAASRGHHVIATELSPRSLAAFAASTEYNGFGSLISIANVSVGASRERICTAPVHADAAWRPEEVLRGYAHPDLHSNTSAAACSATAERKTFADVVPGDANVRAVRISAGAWTSAVLQSALPFFAERPPAVVLVEMDVAEMERAGHSNMVELLHEMRALGYTDMSHAGAVCTERWEEITHEVRNRGKLLPSQPLWCKLGPDDFEMVTSRSRALGFAPVTPASKSDDASGVELLFMVYEEPAAKALAGGSDDAALSANSSASGTPDPWLKRWLGDTPEAWEAAHLSPTEPKHMEGQRAVLRQSYEQQQQGGGAQDRETLLQHHAGDVQQQEQQTQDHSDHESGTADQLRPSR